MVDATNVELVFAWQQSRGVARFEGSKANGTARGLGLVLFGIRGSAREGRGLVLDHWNGIDELPVGALAGHGVVQSVHESHEARQAETKHWNECEGHEAWQANL